MDWEPKRPKMRMIMVMGKICEEWGKEDSKAGRRVGKGLSLERIILLFANIYPVSCIHCGKYASPAFKKLTFKLGRQLCATKACQYEAEWDKWTHEEKEKKIFSLEMFISEKNAGKLKKG